MPQDNRIIIAIGAGAAILAAIVLALIFGVNRERPDVPPPAAQGGLTVDVADAPNLEPTRELRCFVDGQYVGMATLAACAQRNGLATEALDVGVDESGALTGFTPPPAPALTEIETPAVVVDDKLTQPTSPVVVDRVERPAPTPTSGNACLRHTQSGWRQLSSSMGLEACVQALYSGACVQPGDAQYGRWGETTLRLVPGRVEQSPDNRRFRTLTRQDRNCQFPDL